MVVGNSWPTNHSSYVYWVVWYYYWRCGGKPPNCQIKYPPIKSAIIIMVVVYSQVYDLTGSTEVNNALYKYYIPLHQMVMEKVSHICCAFAMTAVSMTAMMTMNWKLSGSEFFCTSCGSCSKRYSNSSHCDVHSQFNSKAGIVPEHTSTPLKLHTNKNEDRKEVT